jgi:hypothetical protein
MGTVTNEVSVSTSTVTLLFETSSGVSPDPETTQQGNSTKQIFQSGTPNQPVMVQIQNLDATNPIYVGGPTVAASGATAGIKVLAGAVYPPNGPKPVVGNDSLYALATGGSVNVAVSVGPFQ